MKQFVLTGLVLFCAVSSVCGADAMYGTITGWGQMIDPDGNSRFDVERNRVTITFGPGRKGLDAEGGRSKMNAPRVLASVDGDFTVTTIVKGNMPLPELPYAYVSGGLVLMMDQENYIRLERANFIRRGEKSYYTNFEQRVDAKRTRMGRFADFRLEKDQDVELRLEVIGNRVRALVRHVDEGWHEMGTTKIDRKQSVHVGISGVKTIDDEVAVTFSDLRFSRDSYVEATDSSEIDLSQPAKIVSNPSGPNPALMKLLPKINELQARVNGIARMSDADIDRLIDDAKELASENVEGLPQRKRTAGTGQGAS